MGFRVPSENCRRLKRLEPSWKHGCVGLACPWVLLVLRWPSHVYVRTFVRACVCPAQESQREHAFVDRGVRRARGPREAPPRVSPGVCGLAWRRRRVEDMRRARCAEVSFSWLSSCPRCANPSPPHERGNWRYALEAACINLGLLRAEHPLSIRLLLAEHSLITR